MEVAIKLENNNNTKAAGSQLEVSMGEQHNDVKLTIMVGGARPNAVEVNVDELRKALSAIKKMRD